MRESKPLLHRDTWVNMMLASRNQMNVMSRGFGNTVNGSLPAYGAEGEMNAYLQGVRHTPMRALGSGHTGPKPNFQPITKGQTMDSQEISTKHGWAVVYVVRNNAGYYVVEHFCPKGKSHRVDGKYPTMDEAKESANRIAFQLRNTGVVKGISGLNGYSSLGSPFGASYGTMSLVLASMMYVGADFPGARPVGKKIAKTFNEPRNFVNRVLLFGGLGGLVILTIVEGQK
jgi:hypothetical protein